MNNIDRAKKWDNTSFGILDIEIMRKIVELADEREWLVRKSRARNKAERIAEIDKMLKASRNYLERQFGA